MITEQAVLSLLEVEILGPTDGFILGRSRLDVDDLGPGASAIHWVPYLASALSVNIQRGGKRAGVINTIDVGTLNISLKDEGDPTETPDMRPNTPIRLRSKLSDKPLFTGAISDIDMTHTVDKQTNDIVTVVTISAVDGVQAHANITRSGALAPGGFERWEERIARLAASSGAPINPPPVDAPIVSYSL